MSLPTESRRFSQPEGAPPTSSGSPTWASSLRCSQITLVSARSVTIMRGRYADV